MIAKHGTVTMSGAQKQQARGGGASSRQIGKPKGYGAGKTGGGLEKDLKEVKEDVRELREDVHVLKVKVTEQNGKLDTKIAETKLSIMMWSIGIIVSVGGLVLITMFKLWPMMMDSWWNERFPPEPPAAEIIGFSQGENPGLISLHGSSQFRVEPSCLDFGVSHV